MDTINAGTIYAAAMAAAAIAPEYDLHDARALRVNNAAVKLGHGIPYGFEIPNAEEFEVIKYRGYQQNDDIQAAHAFLECSLHADNWSDLHQAEKEISTPKFMVFKTSEKGHAKILNVRANLERFAKNVKSHAVAFGGGMIRTIKKQKVTWSANALKVAREMLQEKDYAGAFQLATEKLGAMFYTTSTGAVMLMAPVECDTDIMPGMFSAMGEDGFYQVAEYDSGRTAINHQRTRAAAIQKALDRFAEYSPEEVAACLERCKQAGISQDDARAEWMAEHQIDGGTEARIDAQEQRTDEQLEEIDALARQDVAQVLAQATAAAAIEHASDAAALQDDAGAELAECVAVGAESGECEQASGTDSRDLRILSKASDMARAALEQTGADRSALQRESERIAQVGESMGARAGCRDIADTYKEASGILSAWADSAPGADYTGSVETCKPAAPQQTQPDRDTTGQKITGKSGNWEARFFIDPEGVISMQFNERGKAACILQFSTGKERMSFLQQCATMADQDAAAMRADTPPAPTPPAADTMATVAAIEPDYTGPVETSDFETTRSASDDETADYTDPVETSKKPGALSITITRAEGHITECGQPATLASFAEADALLRAWSETAPTTGGYNKCYFEITWPNGETYEGRYDLMHHSREKPSLTDHMVDEAEFYTGKFCPDHMTAKKYAAQMEHIKPETRAAYAEILETMEALGAYFAKARPVALDLRALLASGMKPADLIGYGVTYSGDICNPNGVGAIVDARADDWAGVRVDVILEDGRELDAAARDFSDDKASHRYRLNFKQHGAPYLAELAAKVASIKASATAAKELAAQAKARELVELVDKYPQLKRAENTYSGGKLAAVNIRAMLKQEFKGVKFSVRSDYSRVNIDWTDGPTQKQVDKIVGRFDIGHSDLQTDYFYTKSTAFSELFGGVQYLFTHRNLSDAAVTAIIAQEWPNPEGRPTVDDFRHGRRVCDDPCDNSNRVYKASHTWTPGGTVSE